MRWGSVLLGLLLMLVSLSGTRPLSPPVQWPPAIQTASDPRLLGLEEARQYWKNRERQHRQVGDVVLLAPDTDTFLQALTFWTPDLFFPVLIEEPESTLRFIRAFRPSRIIRLPSSKNVKNSRWRLAQKILSSACFNSKPSLIVGNSIQNEQAAMRSDGLVLTSPDSPSFPGGMALAAGRFQTLARFSPQSAADSLLTQNEALNFATQIELAVKSLFDRFSTLGDQLDFLTIAVPWPDRYEGSDGNRKSPFALDDLLGRLSLTTSRFAFVGRLKNSESESVYQAMCSLFLQPTSAMLFNSYDTKIPPWSEYEMTSAAKNLEPFCRVQLFQGPNNGTRTAWHRAFRGNSNHELVMVNSSGSPTGFTLQGSRASTQDIPWSAPAAVFYIHSFSAARPEDADTLAGRWLANGAFLYFGAIEEPYLQSFRTPSLLTELLAEGVPVAAAAHKINGEDVFGQPWRLHLIGDPMYRLEPPEARDRPRVHDDFQLPETGVELEQTSGSPPIIASPGTLIRHCWDFTLRQGAANSREVLDSSLENWLSNINPGGLDPYEQTLYQTLLADLVMNRPPAAWKRLVEAIPTTQQSGTLKRALEARSTYEDMALDQK